MDNQVKSFKVAVDQAGTMEVKNNTLEIDIPTNIKTLTSPSLTALDTKITKTDQSVSTLANVVYANHMAISAGFTPSTGYTGEKQEVKITYSASITGMPNLEFTYTVYQNKGNNNLVEIIPQPANNSTVTLSRGVVWRIVPSIKGNDSVQVAGKDIYYSTYYPIYTFVSTTSKIASLPDLFEKQSPVSTPKNQTYTYQDVPANNYLYIAFPSTMSVSDATSDGYSVGLVEQDANDQGVKTITLDSITYKVYRTGKPQSAGNYSLTFK